MPGATEILESMAQGETERADELLPLVYEELRRMAAAKMAGERPGHTLQATALVHEVWMKLAGPRAEDLRWNGRQHFCAAAAEAMRRILLDHARRRSAAKRGGEWLEITFGDHEAPTNVKPEEMIDLNEALERLAGLDSEKATVANLRLFGGLTVREIAAALGVSEATAKRRWAFTKAWLSRELRQGEPESEIP